uniref:hypothetical protein n=1 Tax=Thermogemmatispora sp. TaxID=1968838 RepID=UPI0035E4521D
TMLALGWADLLEQALEILGLPEKPILVSDQDDAFAIELPTQLKAADLVSERTLRLLEPLSTSTQQAKQAKKGHVLEDAFDYELEREKERQLQAQLQKLPPALRTPEARLRPPPELEQVLQNGPRPEWPHYKAINMMKAVDTFNEVALRWRELDSVHQWYAVRLLYDLFSQRQNDIEGAQRAWEQYAKQQGLQRKATVTAVQLINPISGKGANAPKSNRLSVGGMESFWLLELLKFRGFMIGAAPYTLRGSKDRKTFVVLPQRVELGTLKRIMHQFREVCWSSTAVKQDILAALRLTQVLIEHRRTELESGQQLDPDELPPIISITQGLDMIFYKDMGSAHAIMNLATINLPSWFPRLHNLEEIDRANEFLGEHIRVIRRIETPKGEEGGEELALLQTYRDFLSGHDLRLFWKFAAMYGNYLFRQREREKNVQRWLPQLTQKGLESLAMSYDKSLSAILENSGFRSIARAIREATVNAQRRHSQENDSTYEVRYGLGNELLRKIHQREAFMQALSEFIYQYNAETAREEEKRAQKEGGRRLTSEDYRRYRLRYPITTADLEQFTALLDSYPTELVASMLVAYGYSRRETPRSEETDQDQSYDHPSDSSDDAEQESE